jgi:hypothetical protein
MEVQTHLMAKAIPKFIQMPLSSGAFVPPESELPHALIEPSALRAAKAYVFE